MTDSLKFISVSHKTASTSEREVYALSEDEKTKLAISLPGVFDNLKGLLLLSTCNRTEIYFESADITTAAMRDYLMEFKGRSGQIGESQSFRSGETTEETITHLLRVSSGIESKVLGDAEIIHQIKKAHHFAMDFKLQGSLLERALQAAFIMHKRISNETNFRDGTTSVAYKSLKMIRKYFGKRSTAKKILFIGAGDIVKQLFKYNAKFKFDKIHIANRSEDKARNLAARHGCLTFPWKHVLSNTFDDFDVIVSAVGHSPNLIQEVPVRQGGILLLDLAMPNNVSKDLADLEEVQLYDLDNISVELDDTRNKRLKALILVKHILRDEVLNYLDWIKNASLRSFLAQYKIVVNEKVKAYYEEVDDVHDEHQVIALTNKVMGKLMADTDTLQSLHHIDNIISKLA